MTSITVSICLGVKLSPCGSSLAEAVVARQNKVSKQAISILIPNPPHRDFEIKPTANHLESSAGKALTNLLAIRLLSPSEKFMAFAKQR
jgi:hypothetical protein